MGDVFYIVGIALTAVAVIVAFTGMRTESFPASKAVMTAVIAVMGTLVVATAAFAVVLSREEAEHREQEQAELAAESGSEAPAEEQAPDVGGETGQTPVTPTGGAVGSDEPSSEGQAVELTSPEDGSLVFETDALEGEAGSLTIAYTNPSAVPHNVALEAGGESLAQGSTVTGGDVSSATADLDAGDYTFFCSIAGHREAGMEGTLTVK